MSGDYEQGNARRDRQIAALQSHVDELTAVVTSQTVLMDALFKQQFASHPEAFASLIDRFTEDLANAKRLGPRDDEADMEQRTRITLWLQRFRDRVLRSILRG